MKKRLMTLVIIFTLSFGALSVSQGWAAVKASLSGGGTYTQGSTVSMTLTYSGGSFGAAKARISYDSSILELQPGSCSGATFNGNLAVMDTLGASSLSCTFVFKAKAVGSTTVSVSTEQGTTDDGIDFNNGASATVKVQAPKTETPKSPASSGTSKKPSSSSSSKNTSSSSSSKKPSSSSQSSDNRGEFNESSVGVPEETEEPVEEEKKPDPKPAKVEVKYDDKTWTIVEDLKEEDIPIGFKAGKATYGEWDWEIVVYTDENGHMLICLEDKETKERRFFTYNDEKDTFGNSISVTVAQYLDIDKTKAELEESQEQVKELSEKPNLLPALIATGTVAVVSIGAAIFAFLRKKGPVVPKE